MKVQSSINSHTTTAVVEDGGMGCLFAVYSVMPHALGRLFFIHGASVRGGQFNCGLLAKFNELCLAKSNNLLTHNLIYSQSVTLLYMRRDGLWCKMIGDVSK